MKAPQQCEAEKIIDANDEVTGNNPQLLEGQLYYESRKHVKTSHTGN